MYSPYHSHTKIVSSIVLFDTFVAILLVLVLSPLMLINALLAIVAGKSALRSMQRSDALGRPQSLLQWRKGVLKKSALLFNVMKGNISMCGVSLHSVCTNDALSTLTPLKPGIISLFDTHKSVGNIEMTHGESIRHHEKHNSIQFNALLIVKYIICSILYRNSSKGLSSPLKFSLFGININNLTLNEALEVIFNHTSIRAKSVFFVNVNSVNLAHDNKDFLETLNCGDYVFADGSGVRLGAKHNGINLRDNLNGTDLLPHICTQANARKQSLYLLGSAPGVASTAAKNLQIQFPGLVIAGTQHGFFNQEQEADVIADINQSGADICLVAMGSPIQESWVSRNKDKLNTHTTMAVGGLFDFYSGRISRCPMWMRELGMEWMYRLMQEPKAKFNRYVVGNPLFLLRLFTQVKNS
ncbi:WecB/TagA/CpsF family glycosyltransferase [Teredinibacter purpureus]|uniref:WecB/TagA/CpsF family glycosyltransferase n=1 Tax=Teredinibacter purpureus TaxID=2731756 RepID=UPI0005F791C0|nr:WecB/TagA/CpsF family glycosyltransferase [Teredinibacter purpureus]